MSCAVSLEALRLPRAGPLPKLLLPEEEGQLLPGQDSSEQANCVQLRESHHRPITQIQVLGTTRTGLLPFPPAKVFPRLPLSTEKKKIRCAELIAKCIPWFPEVKNFEIATLQDPFVEPGPAGGLSKVTDTHCPQNSSRETMGDRRARWRPRGYVCSHL